MADDKPIAFSHKELAEILVKHSGKRDGIWGLYIEFGIAAANVGPDRDNLNPCAIVPVKKIGLQRFPEESNIAVDAKKLQKRISARKKKSS